MTESNRQTKSSCDGKTYRATVLTPSPASKVVETLSDKGTPPAAEFSDPIMRYDPELPNCSSLCATPLIPTFVSHGCTPLTLKSGLASLSIDCHGTELIDEGIWGKSDISRVGEGVMRFRGILD
jgi:hypothetical protein